MKSKNNKLENFTIKIEMINNRIKYIIKITIIKNQIKKECKNLLQIVLHNVKQLYKTIYTIKNQNNNKIQFNYLKKWFKGIQ